MLVAFGSSYIINDKNSIGSCKHSDICTFFSSSKVITTGGERLLWIQKTLWKNAFIRSYDNKSKRHWKYDVLEPGYNLRLSEINATLGLNQLKQLGKFLVIEKNF